MANMVETAGNNRNAPISTRAILLLIVITVGAFGLRVANLGRRSLWLDEAVEAEFASCNLKRCWLADANVPPLNRTILHFWTRAFGKSEFSLRFPSVIFGTLCIPALFFLGRRLFGDKVAWLATILFATRPFAIEISQEARQYPLLVLLTILATHCFVKHMQQPSLWIMACYAVCAALGLYTFYLFGFVLLTHIAWYVMPGEKTTRKTITLASACLIAAIAYIPWTPMLIKALGHQESGWIAGPGLWAQIYHIFQSYGPGISAYDLRGLAIPDFAHVSTLNDIRTRIYICSKQPLAKFIAIVSIYSLRELLVILGFIVPFIWGCVIAIARKGGKSAFPVVTFFLPLVILAALFWWVPVVTPRYMQFIMPAYILLTALFLVRMWRTPAGIAATVSMGVLLCLSMFIYYFSPSYGKEDYRAALRDVSQGSRKSDIVMCYPDYISSAVQYYYHGPGAFVPLHDLKNDGFHLPVNQEESADTKHPSQENGLARFAARPGSRVWAVVRGTSSQSEKERLVALFSPHYSQMKHKRYEAGRGIDVYLFHNEAHKPASPDGHPQRDAESK